MKFPLQEPKYSISGYDFLHTCLEDNKRGLQNKTFSCNRTG